MCALTEPALPIARPRGSVGQEHRRLHLRGHVLPGGQVRDVYVVGGRITFESPGRVEPVVDGGWLVPGLVDGHAHLALASPAGPSATEEERVEASARAQLAAGVLLVREPGSPGHASRGVGPERGLPRTVTAGRFLAPPGGLLPGAGAGGRRGPARRRGH
ncbi:hypothetical protein [Nocardioides sp.]|uniref:hypothetical protein n=1 Tax=Nocardioides sp. TaxID=35761 RepID=UPI002736844B|nr:hypothetical protein [Nocardioides sp.]MDP3890774.1 hypothetical protein [Nocardioides sp.]